MKNKYIVIHLVLFTFLIISFTKDQNKICYRVKNNTKYKIKEISLFSMPYKYLDVEKKSNYKVLKFNKRTNNSMLSLTADTKRFSIYVSPVEISGKYTYIIDSLDFEKRYIYYTVCKG